MRGREEEERGEGRECEGCYIKVKKRSEVRGGKETGSRSGHACMIN